MAFHPAVEDVTHKGGLARTAHSGDNGHHVERKAHVNACKVVLPGTTHEQAAVPGTAAGGDVDCLFVKEVAHRVALRPGPQVGEVALIDHLAAAPSCLGANVDDVVGSPDDLLVVFDDDDGVAQLLEPAQDTDKALRVAAVEADARLVKDVKRTDKRTAQRGSQVDALALAAGERVAEPVERKIAQADIDKEVKAAAYLGEQAVGHALLRLSEFEMLEEVEEVRDRQVDKLGNGPAAHLDVRSLTFKASAVTLGADGLSAITGEHHAILDLVLVLFEHSEESIDRHLLLLGQGTLLGVAVPEQVPLLARKLIIRHKDWEPFFLGPPAEFLAPHAHFLSTPTHHRTVVDAQRAVGHDESLVESDNAAEAFAARAGAKGRIEGEHVVVRLAEGHPVGLEARREAVDGARGVDTEHALAVALEKGGLGRIHKTGYGVLLAGDGHTVDEQGKGGRVGVRLAGVLVEIVLYTHHLATGVNTREPLLQVNLQLLAERAAVGHAHRGQDGETRSGRIAERTLHHVLRGMALHLTATEGRERTADTGVKQAEVVVHLSRGADRGARVAARDLLLDGNGRREAFYVVALGLVHTAQELAGIGREALDITALPLGVEGVERKRRLARARQAGDDDEAVAGNVEVDVLQVVHPGAFNADIFVHKGRSC
ncbi:uncharacterized protein BN773_00888 [Prevotella sp. CAG:755]|nr:uncharacterized protein BN773_00888 [Prevotella sp. CAG:755]